MAPGCSRGMQSHAIGHRRLVDTMSTHHQAPCKACCTQSQRKQPFQPLKSGAARWRQLG